MRRIRLSLEILQTAAIAAGFDQVDFLEEPAAAAMHYHVSHATRHDTVVVDIGGGTTDIAVFSDGAIRHTAVIPIAGDQITSDIAMALRTSL